MGKNIAVIGCGYWGKNLVRNFAELGALHTICDADPTVLEQFALPYPDISAEAEYQQVLNNPEIKGVVIATPALLHYFMSKQALLAGKDVFVEKPLALNIMEGKELVELAQEKHRILMVGHLLEYHPAVLKLKKLIDKGELGKIQYIYSNRLNLGKFRTEENILWSFAPHDISAILLLLGGEMPQDVSAHGGYYLHPDIADVTLSTMSFRDGVKAHIFVSWLHPFKEQRLVVEHKPVPRPKEAEVIEIPTEEPLKIECQDFIQCIDSRQKPKVDGYKGLQVLEVLAHCQKSLEEGGRVISLGKEEMNFFVHETSILEEPFEIGEGTKIWHFSHIMPGFEIGEGTKIWHFSHIMPGVTIGENCVIGQNVFIGKGVSIGNNVKLENNVSVFEGVILEDDVFCGPSCVFTNVINPRSHVSRKHEFKPTLVKQGASIGASATIVCGNTIGRYALIGAGAVVTKIVPDYALVYGNPARIKGWVCECGVRLEFGEGGEAQCTGCRKSYQRKGEREIAVKSD